MDRRSEMGNHCRASPEPGASILIVSLSARALAGLAADAGLRPLVVDLFGDQDLRERGWRFRTAAGNDSGFQPDSLARAVAELDPRQQLGVVYGSGFEAVPEHLTRVCGKRPLLGNIPAVVRKVKDPIRLCTLLTRLRIPTPETALAVPCRADGWLLKRRGGSGGSHVRNCVEGSRVDAGWYAQRRVPGRTLGITLVADGSRAWVVGYARQWKGGQAHDGGFGYRGAVSLPAARLPGRVRSRIGEALNALVSATGLLGLCSVDIVVDGDRWWLIDINPRPGANAELYCGPGAPLRWHLDAVAGHFSGVPAERVDLLQRAVRIVYARRTLWVPPAYRWPGWVTDRPSPGSRIAAGWPVCSVHAEGGDSMRAAHCLQLRVSSLEKTVRSWQPTHANPRSVSTR